MRKKMLIGLSIVLGIAIVIGLLVDNNFDSKKTKDAEKFSKEYKMVDKDNVFEYKSLEEINKIIKKDSGVIFFGTPSDDWSQEYAKYLNETAKEAILDTIYYCDISNDKKQNTKAYKELLELLDQSSISIPISVYVIEGKIIYKEKSLTDNKDKKVEEYFTEEKVSDLKDNFAGYMLQVVAYFNSCDEDCDD